MSATEKTAAVPALPPGIAAKINALHADARRLEKESWKKLRASVAAAWQAGKLLLDAKATITRLGGRGAWTPWVKTMFAGGIRTAQRYMKLARELPAHIALANKLLRVLRASRKNIQPQYLSALYKQLRTIIEPDDFGTHPTGCNRK
jgi:hypothetical protein